MIDKFSSLDPETADTTNVAAKSLLDISFPSSDEFQDLHLSSLFASIEEPEELQENRLVDFCKTMFVFISYNMLELVYINLY